jgi:hypothetical protein
VLFRLIRCAFSLGKTLLEIAGLARDFKLKIFS